MIARTLVVLTLLASVAVHAGESKNADTAKATPAKAVTAKLHWVPFDSVRATFPAAPKPLFLYISQAGCSHCEYMDTAVFSRPEVAKYVNENLTPVRVDIYMDTPIKVRDTVLTEEQFRKLLAIKGTPAYYFFDTNGNVIGVLDSQMELMTFKRMLVYIRDQYFFLMPWVKFLSSPAAADEAINKKF